MPFEYGAFLWTLTYDELNELVHRRATQDLAELVRAGVADPEWDEEAFREAVSDNLEKGSFILVIAVDEMNPELERTMRFLNACSSAAFAFSVLEMRRFQKDGTEVLVPQVHGTPSPTQARDSGKHRRWKKEMFQEEIKKTMDVGTQTAAMDLMEWTGEKADRLRFGTGKVTGSFSFHYKKNGVTYSVFAVQTNDLIMLNYGYLAPVIDKALMQELHNRLTAVPSLAGIPHEFYRIHSIRLSDAFGGKPAELAQFKQVVEWLGQRIKGE